MGETAERVGLRPFLAGEARSFQGRHCMLLGWVLLSYSWTRVGLWRFSGCRVQKLAMNAATAWMQAVCMQLCAVGLLLS